MTSPSETRSPQPAPEPKPEPEPEARAPKSGRLLGLDALRGIAVFLMIEQHLGVWLWEGPRAGQSMAHYPGLLVFNALGGGAAPAFVTLAGIGSSLLAIKRERRGDNPDVTLLTRGLVLLAFGYLLSLLTPSWFSYRSWFVLHLMGVGMMSMPLWRRLPTGVVLGVGLAVLASTGVLQAAVGVPLELDNRYMSGRAPHSPDALAGVRIALFEGQFPVFPWFSFFLAGVACGRWVEAKQLGRIASLAGSVAALGLVGVLLRSVASGPSTGVLARTTSLRVPFFPASPTLVALLLAGVLFGIWAVMAYERRWSIRENNPLVTLGRASLTLLIFHVFWFRELTRTDGWWQALPPLRWLGEHMHWWRSLSVGEAMAVLWGFVAFAAVASWAWQKVDYKYGAEWVLRQVAR